MGNLHVVLSLTTKESDYQQHQAASAQEVALRLGIDLEVLFADNDSINQSQQLLSIIQSHDHRPNAIALEPVSGTGFPQVAKAAVSAGIGWALVNLNADYLSSLRLSNSVPAFAVSADHVAVGRIQAEQLKLLLPEGGLALYVQGPGMASAAADRTRGMEERKPANIQLRAIRGNWTEESARAAVTAWLRLSTSHNLPVRAVVAQNDAMALGARKAFENETTGAERERWLQLPFLGCDGLPQTGKVWVQKNLLKATVILPATAVKVLEMLAHALRTSTQPEASTLMAPTSYPTLERLAPTQQHAAGS